MRITGRLVMALAVTPSALALLAGPAPAHAARPAIAEAVRAPTAGVTSGSLSGDSEAFAMRVEYDIPLPAGTGTVPHVVGTIGRSNGTDTVHGLAGAPSQLDAVVGGQYVDPNGINNNQPVNRLPQAECFSPGPVPLAVFRFPTDTQAGTSSAPATAVATAECAAGPTLTMHAYDAATGQAGTPTAALAPVLKSGASTADGTAGPVEGHLLSEAAATGSGVDVLGGVIHVGSVRVQDRSAIDGKRGGGTSEGSVEISGMTVAGTPASLSGGRLAVAGQSAPLDSTAGRRLLDQLNAGLSSSGCKLSALDQPSAYPQGFLLSRPPPKLGVAPDGSSAASEVGGLLVICDVPQSISSHEGGFSPQRVQIVLGFAFTAVSTRSDPGGFGLANLGGGSVPTSGNPVPVESPLAAAVGHPAVPTAELPAAVRDLPAASPPVAPASPASSPVALAPVATALRAPSLGDTARAALFAMCLLGWCVLTTALLRALRGVTAG